MRQLESGWNSEHEFANFLEFLRDLGLLFEARVLCAMLLNLQYIQRASDVINNQEKIYCFQCKNNFTQILIQTCQKQIFPSLQPLARIWHLVWASLVLKTSRNQAQLVLDLAFVFYLIKIGFKCFNSKINQINWEGGVASSIEVMDNLIIKFES